MKVTFKKNPVGQFNLSYEINETVNVPKALAEKLIEAGVAVASVSESDDDSSDEVETADSKETTEKAVGKSGKGK